MALGGIRCAIKHTQHNSFWHILTNWFGAFLWLKKISWILWFVSVMQDFPQKGWPLGAIEKGSRFGGRTSPHAARGTHPGGIARPETSVPPRGTTLHSPRRNPPSWRSLCQSLPSEARSLARAPKQQTLTDHPTTRLRRRWLASSLNRAAESSASGRE